MLKNKNFILLIAIVILGFLLRVWAVGDFPRGLHRDEAFLGYNGYSIAKTAKDMTGIFLPLHLKSFIYSPGGYSYFSIIPILLFGLNSFSIRLASVIFGSLTIVALYFLAKEVYIKDKRKEYIGLFSAFFLAILPWHIILSRTATENVLVTFFVVVGIYLFLVASRKSSLLLYSLSYLSFGITLLLYQAPRAFLPLFIPLLFMIYLRKLKKSLILTNIGLYLIIIVVPVCFILISPQLSLRIQSLSLFGNTGGQLVLQEELHNSATHVPPLVERLFQNKIILYTTEFTQNYFNHLSYDFLFTDSGLPNRYRVPLSGLLYLFELPVVFIGVITVTSKNKKIALLLLGWILLTPIGSALTYDDVPNLQRTLFMTPALCMLLAVGVVVLYSFPKQKYLQALVVVGIMVLSLFSIAYFLNQYFVQAPVYRPWYRMDGYKELVKDVTDIQKGYKKIVITNTESAPTIFFLFYTQYNPALFQEETKRSTFKDFDRISFAQYEFSTQQCPLQALLASTRMTPVDQMQGVLFVESGLCIPMPQENVLKIIKRADNSPVFMLTTVNTQSLTSL